MKKHFICSLCHHGILGGWLTVKEDAVTYTTGKVTVDEKYRNLRMPVSEIASISWKWVVFPQASITMKDGSIYRFLIFNKWRFADTMSGLGDYQ